MSQASIKIEFIWNGETRDSSKRIIDILRDLININQIKIKKEDQILLMQSSLASVRTYPFKISR